MRMGASTMAVLLAVSPVWAGMGSVHASLGWGQVKQTYDVDGNAQDLPNNGSLSVLNLHLGGMYNLVSLPMQRIFVGGGLHLQQRSQSATVANQEVSLSSGFAPQGVAVFVGLGGPMYSAKLGFLTDLGPEGDPNVLANSDRQHAMFVKLGAHLPNPMLALGGFVQYFLTLSRTENNISMDNGDWLIVGGRVGYRIPLGEVGLVLSYILRTSMKANGQDIPDSDGYMLSLAPYLRLALPMSPVSFMLKLAAFDEYTYYGLSLAGKNMPVTRLGFTLGAMIKI